MTLLGLSVIIIAFMAAVVVLKYAFKLVSWLLGIMLIVGLVCWFYPPFFTVVKPIIDSATPFAKEGLDAATTSAEIISEKLKKQ